MESYEGRILLIEGEDANISYLTDTEQLFHNSTASHTLPRTPLQCSYIKDRYKDNHMQIIIVAIDENHIKVIIKHGKICEYCESDNAIQIRFFSEQITIKCSAEIVFIEDRKIEINELRYYLEFPIEALLINNQCAKVTIITTIPKKIRAVIVSVNGSSVYLRDPIAFTGDYFEVDCSDCYEKYAIKPLSLEELHNCAEQEVEIGVYSSFCRVQLTTILQKKSEERKTIEFEKFVGPTIREVAREFIRDLLPLSYNDEAGLNLWYRCGFNFSSNIKLALLVSVLETMHCHKDYDVFLRGNQLLQGNILKDYSKDIKQLLFDIQNQCFIDSTTLNYALFYRLLDRSRENLEKIAGLLIPCVKNRVLYDKIAKDFAVCINIYEILGSEVLNTMYSPRHHDTVPVIHLLIKDTYAWTIYSSMHMTNTGFSLQSLEQGNNISINKYREWPVYYLSAMCLK